MSGWRKATIAECASNEPYSTQIGPFGEKIRADIYTPEGAPVLRGTNVNPDGRFHDDDFVFIDPELAEKEFSKFVCEADDVILCHKGTLGKIGVIPRNGRFKKYIMGNSMMKVRCDRDKLHPLYLYYWLCSREGQNYLFSRVSQVGVPQIQRPLSTLREASLPLPPIHEQNAIASVLGALDDKIELNQRMNETLEAMAQGLFKSWFVDATQAGLPKGWRVGTLGELIELAYGKALKEENRRLGEIPVFGSNGQVGWHNEKLVAGPGIVVGRKGNPGIVTWSPTDFFPIDTTFYVVPKGECRSLYFLFYALRAHDLASLGADSAVPGLNRNMAYLSQQIVPPPEALNRFDGVVKPLFENIHANDSESRTLVALRDALLPRLLSGELRAPNC